MSGFTISALLILAVGLYYNYQQDKGQHRKAKIWQAICLGLLVQAYAGTVRQALWLPGHWDTAYQKYSRAVGFMPGTGHWLFYLLHIGFALLALGTVTGMVNRSNVARQRLFWLLPLLVLFETFSFYRGWLSDGSVEITTHYIILLVGFIFNGMIALGMLLLYRSQFMKAFYQVEPAAIEATPALDERAHGEATNIS
jgi:hypothetical protein